MQQIIKKLYDCLQDELLYYVSLEDLIQREQQLVRSIDADGVFRAAEQKEALVLKLRENEAKRAAIIDELAPRLGCPPEKVRVALLLDHLNPTARQLLSDLRDKLRAVIQRVQTETQRLQERLLISHYTIDDTMTFIRQQLAGPATDTVYAASAGARPHPGATPSMLVSRRA